MAGSMPADELIELLGIPIKRTADFHTVAGMVLAAMRRLPKEGDSVVVGGWRFEVLWACCSLRASPRQPNAARK